MAWQEKFTELFGPGLFNGANVPVWLGLLRRNRFRFEPRRFLRVSAACSAALSNSVNGRLERWRFERRYEEAEVRQPVFILGHFRSGTTHLHNIFAQDERFAFPNLFQVNYPRIFLSTEAFATKLMAPLLPKTRFGLDNMALKWGTAYEDEFVMAGGFGLSPYATFAFPQQFEHFDRYLDLSELSAVELAEWKTVLQTFLRKLSWKYERPLVLKSPYHTARIRTILDMYPDAKFVHIHRHPFAVFQSTKRLLGVIDRFWALQHQSYDWWEERAVQHYRRMYDAFFADRARIPEENYCELSFRELEENPTEAIERIYRSLDLPEFEQFKPRLESYVNSLTGYRKNQFVDLTVAERERIVKEWGRSFDTWGYVPDEP